MNCPAVTITYNKKLSTQALIDTGACFSCINQSWYEDNKKQLGNHETLPLRNVTLTTATGQSVKKLKKIILLSGNINGVQFNTQYIVVPGLVRHVILGSETLQELQAMVDFNNKIMRIYSTTCFNNSGDQINTDYIDIPLKLGGYTEDRISECLIKYTNDEEEIEAEGETISYRKSRDTEENNEQLNYLRQTAYENKLLTDEQKKELYHLLYKYKEIFSDKPGMCNRYEYQIKLKNYEPYKARIYPIPACLREEVDNEIQAMLKDQIIERSHSGYVNPLIAVKKKDGKIRLCLDARNINTRIFNDYDYNPGVHDLLSKGRKAKYLSTIDLTASFWQIPLEKHSREYTAFQHKGKTYQFIRVPFGLSISQAALIRALEAVLGEEVEGYTMLYIDDACIYSQDFKQHLQHLETIFSKFAQANMTINLKKSQIVREKVPFLGFILTTSGIESDPEKLAIIERFPIPKTRKQLKGFIGLVNYYNKFTNKFSETIQPLMKLTSKNNKFIWTAKETETFEKVKELFIKTNTLTYPDYNKEFYLECDSSNYSIGGHLFQIDENGDKAGIMFISRTLRPSEISYFTTEKELLSILFSLQKVRHIVLGHKINIMTDHQALTFIRTCKLLNPRLTRWILMLQEYNYTIKHCPGKTNIVADTLSRIKIQEDKGTDPVNTRIIITLMNYEPSTKFIKQLEEITIHQQQDPKLQELYHKLITERIPLPPIPLPKHIMYKDTIWKQTRQGWKLVIPEKLIKQLIEECHHYYLHCGGSKCLTLIQEHFTFKNMGKRIRKQIASCDTCQKCKYSTHPLQAEAIGIKCTEKNDQLSCDVIGPLPRGQGGMKYIFVIVDIFTKFIKLYPMRRVTTNAILDKICNQYIPQFGNPKKIQSDNATYFKNMRYIKNLEQRNIIPIYSPIKTPQMNITERYIAYIKQGLRTLCHNNHTNWVNKIPWINRCLNEIQNTTTGFTPNELQLQRRDIRFWEGHINIPEQPHIPIQVKIELTRQRIRNKQRKVAEKKNLNKRLNTLKIGDHVLVTQKPLSESEKGTTHKLFCIYAGPYRIVRQLGKTVYTVSEIDRVQEKGPYHISQLRPYKYPIQESIEPENQLT